MISERVLYTLLLLGLNLLCTKAFLQRNTNEHTGMKETTFGLIRGYVQGQGEYRSVYTSAVERDLQLQALSVSEEKKSLAVALYGT